MLTGHCFRSARALCLSLSKTSMFRTWHLPVVVWPEPTEADEREDRWFGLYWKTRALVDWAAGRPFAWVDDEITDADRDWVSAHHPGPALLRRIEASRGLTDEDFVVLGTWLRECQR
jgi:hypothetical protein